MKLRTALLATVPLVAALGLAATAEGGAAKNTVKLEKLPYSGGVLMARGIRNGTIHLSPVWGGGENHAPPGLKCTPAPCALPNVDASTGTSQPVDETPIAVNTLNAKQLITGGNDYNCTGSSYRGFWTSNDGGSKWKGACGLDAPGTSGGSGDPVVGYDLLGHVFQGGIDNGSGGLVISVASSTDNGTTWGTPVIAANVTGLSADKPWLQIDTSAGSRWPNWLYISNTMFGAGSSSTIYVSHSSDNGKTWTSVKVSPTDNLPHVNQFSDLAIDSTGKVYLTYQDCPGGGPTGDCGGTKATMYIQTSNDGGNTWTKQVAIGTANLAPDACGCAYYGSLPNTSERVSNIPVIGVDNSGGTMNGNLYVAYYNWTGTYMKEQVTTSKDGGNTWSAPVPVAPKTDKHDQFFNWLNVDSKGNVGVTWLDRGADPNNLSYVATATWSGDGGTSFHTDVPIASAPSNPDNDGFGGGFMGDYSGNYWSGSKLFTSWTDTRNGSYSQDEVGGLKR